MASTHGPSPATKETLTEELEVPRLSMHLGANYIRREYIRKNKPFVLTEAGVEEWRSWKEWRNGAQAYAVMRRAVGALTRVAR